MKAARSRLSLRTVNSCVAYGVLGHEAEVVESLEQRHAGDSLLRNEFAEVVCVERAECFRGDDCC